LPAKAVRFTLSLVHAPPPPTMRIAAAAAAGAVLCCISVAVTLSGVDTGDAELAAAGRALIVAAPVAVGCYAWHRRPGEPFGPLLVATGFAWFLTTLSESDDSLLYSTGRVAGWLVEVQLIYLALSFPTGRLTARADRLLVGTAAGLVAVLYLPSALLADSYPLPAPYTSCETGCPANAFFVLGSEPGVMDAVVKPLREAMTVVVFLAATARMGMRVRRASRLMRRVLSPVLVVALVHVFVIAVGVTVRRADPGSPALDALKWVLAMGLPAMSLSFLVGLLGGRLFVASSLATLGRRVHPGLDPPGVRAALADALDDPSLWLAYWVPSDGGGWVDAEGQAVELPGEGSGQCVTEVAEAGRRIAAIVHDEALREQQELVEAAAAYARIALENQRLGAKVESSLREVRESRARILASADRERRRIERDLHDGAQQRLVALRIKLELAEELVREDRDAGLDKLHALGTEIEATLDEIRSLARGVYPPLLAEQGLALALRAAAMRAAVPAAVRADGIGRYPQELESAVYFCCLEALQNASKHAGGASRVTISLSHDQALRFEVRDDGAGFDPGEHHDGAGLTNMRDRLVAIGGELTIASEPGRGAVVRGSVPITRTG
jgi:signal transduction histidine kinase